MRIIKGRVRRSAPTHTTRNNGQSAVVCDITTTSGCFPLNVCNLSSGHCRNSIARGKAYLLSISRASIGGRVGANIISRTYLQTCNATGEAALACAVGAVAVAHGRVGACAPANTPCRKTQASIVRNVAATCGTYRSNACDAVRCQGGNAVTSSKALLVTIHRAIRSNSVGTDIVGGCNVKASHRNGECAHAAFCFFIEVVVGRGILMRGPAKAFHEDVGAHQ